MRRGHVVICGTGRAGTTLLLKILHKAGLRDMRRGRLERRMTAATAASLPDLVKSLKFYKITD